MDVDVETRSDPCAGCFLHAERDARHELVLAVDDAGVEPAAGDVGDLERLLEVDGWLQPATASAAAKGGA